MTPRIRKRLVLFALALGAAFQFAHVGPPPVAFAQTIVEEWGQVGASGPG